MRAFLKIITVVTFLFTSISCGFAQEPLYLAPDFTVEDLKGNSVSLSDYKGKPVIIMFWTVSCDICKSEIKALSKRYDEVKNSGVDFMMIDVADPKYRVENFLSAYGIKFEPLLDKEARAAMAYEIPGVPTYYVINKGGEIIAEDYRFPYAELNSLKAAQSAGAKHE